MDFISFMLTTGDDGAENSAAGFSRIPANYIPRPRLRDWENPLEKLSDTEFKERYRFTKQGIHDFLLVIIDDFARPGKGQGLPALHKLLVFLRFVSSGSFQLLAGDLEEIKQPTVSKIIKEVSVIIVSRIEQFVKWPQGQLDRCKEDFYAIAGFPGVIGAIDCTHIRIQSPGGEHAERYRNRKGYFSINCQAVCNADLVFTNICARWFGSTHDSRIFLNSQLCAYLESQTRSGYILGDQGYPLTPYLLTPFRTTSSNAEANYNRAHKKTRLVIERAFGILKRVFSCLKTGLRLKLETTMNVIPACVAIYNFLRHRQIIDPSEFSFEEDEESGLISPRRHAHFTRASAVRQELARMHFSH